MRGSIVCLAEVFAAELWFLWINWLSGHIHRVFCRQTQVCLAHAPSPSGRRSALAQKLRNWCWAGSRTPLERPGMAVQAQGPAATTTGYLPSADLGLNQLIFLSVGAGVGLNSETQSCFAGDGNCEVVFILWPVWALVKNLLSYSRPDTLAIRKLLLPKAEHHHHHWETLWGKSCEWGMVVACFH